MTIQDDITLDIKKLCELDTPAYILRNGVIRILDVDIVH